MDAIFLPRNTLCIATQIISLPMASVLSEQDTAFPYHLTAWHWSFFITDGNGDTTQHHWTIAPPTSSADRRLFYHHRVIPVVRPMTAQTVYVAFAHVNGWNGPESEVLEAELQALYLAHAGEREVDLHLLVNPVTCRTWIMDALPWPGFPP